MNFFSFDARGVTSIVEDQIQVTLATVIMTDCFNALKILSNASRYRLFKKRTS